MIEEERYPVEVLDEDDDDGTMPKRVGELTSHVVGHRIVEVIRDDRIPSKYTWGDDERGMTLVLDNGKRVSLIDNGDCCAYTTLKDVIVNLYKIDHVITGVGTTEGYKRWHIYADLGDVVELNVGWSSGNTGYYGYGFDLVVREESE